MYLLHIFSSYLCFPYPLTRCHFELLLLLLYSLDSLVFDLIAVLARLFWPFFAITPVHLSLSLATRATYAAHLYAGSAPFLYFSSPSLSSGGNSAPTPESTTSSSLFPLFISSRLACYLYYACVVIGTQRLVHDARLFTREGLRQIKR